MKGAAHVYSEPLQYLRFSKCSVASLPGADLGVWYMLIFYSAKHHEPRLSAIMSTTTAIIVAGTGCTGGFPAARMGTGLESHLLVWTTLATAFVHQRVRLTWVLIFYV